MLNGVLRPVVAKWHPLLLDHEARRPEGVSMVDHERLWERDRELREELAAARTALAEYANLLAKVADVPPLI